MSDTVTTAGSVTTTGSATSGVSVSPNPGSMSTTTTTTTPPSWTQGFTDELKGYVDAKGFKDAQTVVESYRNFEKLKGVPQERLLTIPEKDEDPSWNDVWKRLGRPDQPKDYNIEIPKEFGDEGFAQWAKDTLHKLNIPRKQGEELVKKWNEYTGNQIKQMQLESSNKLNQEHESLKKEWGQAYEQNVEMGKRAAKAFGFDESTIDALESAMGFAGVMKFMHNLQTKIGEDSFVSPSQSSSPMGKMSPEQARNRIAMLKSDPDFVKRYIAGENAPRTEMQMLHEMAYSG